MRSILTTLGIVIGVAAVIAMMEIGKGSSSSISKSIAGMGANNILILPGTAASGGVSFGAGSVMTLTPGDCDAIIRECPSVKHACPYVRARTQLVYSGRNWVPNTIRGTTPSCLDVRDWNSFTEGEMFTDRDVAAAAKVCVIGQTIARELFQGESPIGKEIRMKNNGFKVVGVLTPKGANMMGMDQDDIVLAPWTSIKYRVTGSSLTSSNQADSSSSSSYSRKQLYPGGSAALYPAKSEAQAAANLTSLRIANVDEINASAKSPGEIKSAIDEITVLLRERHKIRPGQADDFNIRDMTEMINAMSATTKVMTNLLLCVAMISLLVGGVGIMNIMLVSVTERTREIGLRMAVGARARDILTQFLVEAVLLCLVGGALGITLGHGGSLLVRHFLRWPVETSPAAIAAAVLVSAAVGIIFGWYPAWKASRLNPIDALRYE
jgi:ABC-type antimicrobial peptide transport system permease subunit